MGCYGRKSSDWLLSFLDYEVMEWPSGRTLGKICPAGHQWNGLNATLRSYGQCISCKKVRNAETAKRKALDPDYRARRSAANKASAAKRMAQDPEGEMRKRKDLSRKKIESGKTRQYRAAARQRMIEKGLTTRGTKPYCTSEQATRKAFQRAIRNAGQSPSVARLVMNEQRRYWRENPSAKADHDRQWRQAIWWLKYQIKPELRLYNREKSKRRKARMKGNTFIEVSSQHINERFELFNNCCAYCGQSGDMQIEHAIPISKGGTHAIGNILPACRTCNYSKRDKEIESWYRSQSVFTELRWRKIRRTLGWTGGAVNQLAMI